MAKPRKHSTRFLNLVDDAKTRIREISVEKVLADLKAGKQLNIIDVREEREYLISHIPSVRHIGKGVIERDIGKWYRNVDEELILYCGGGFRSALAADALVSANTRLKAEGVRACMCARIVHVCRHGFVCIISRISLPLYLSLTDSEASGQSQATSSLLCHVPIDATARGTCADGRTAK